MSPINANLPLNSIRSTGAAEAAAVEGRGSVNIRKTGKRLYGYAKRYKGLLLLILLFAVVGNVLALTAPMLIGEGINSIVGVGNVDYANLVRIIVILAGTYVLSTVLQWICAALATKAATQTVYQIRKDAFDNLTNLPMKFIDRRSHGDLISSFSNDADAVSDGLTQLFTQLFAGIVTIAAALGFMLYLSPIVTAAVVVVTPLVFLVAKFVTKLSGKQFVAQQRLLGELNGYVEEQIKGLRVAKAFGYEDRARKTFSEINGRLYGVGQKAQFYSSLTNPTTRFLNYVSYVLVGVVGGLCAIFLGFSVGGIASFITYSSLFSRPFNELTAITTQLMSALAAAERIFAIIDEPREESDSGNAVLPTDAKGEVGFHDVSFSYLPERPLIKGFCLQVPAGSTVAIVGPTGAGKTTMVNLLMRFYEVTGGSITIDGTDVHSLTRNSLRRSFGMVLQETWLFEGSIRDNIAYGKPDATDEEIKAASKAASAHSFIRRLPNGYNTQIEEGGENLSQGQRQLLTIARAMLLNPPMLILDEATSSVDTLTEQKIQRTFLQMMQGRTSFVIAHRLSTIREADLIIVMNNGEVIEQGTHQELLRRGGFYAGLYNSQFQ